MTPRKSNYLKKVSRFFKKDWRTNIIIILTAIGMIATFVFKCDEDNAKKIEMKYSISINEESLFNEFASNNIMSLKILVDNSASVNNVIENIEIFLKNDMNEIKLEIFSLSIGYGDYSNLPFNIPSNSVKTILVDVLIPISLILSCDQNVFADMNQKDAFDSIFRMDKLEIFDSNGNKMNNVELIIKIKDKLENNELRLLLDK